MLERGGPPAPRAEITRQGQTIHLRYEMDRDAEVWAFYDSALMSEVRQPWRPTQWRVLTPGVRLVRAGAYDALVNEAGGPVPRAIDIEITPKGVDLEAEYPTLVFSNGAVALPTRQASVFPVDSLEELAALSSDLNAVELDVGPTKVTWRDQSGPVLYQGERRPMLITQFERSYVLLGDADVTRDDGLTAVIDPALPKWMADTLSEAAPATGRGYRQRLGPASAGAEKPVLMAAWNGPAERMSSMGGSVLPGLIVMNFEGRGIVEPDDEVRERALWFIAHEAAHFWLGQTVRYEYAREAWITEGGADLLAVRALKARDPAYDAKAELQREVDDCIRLARQPVNTAGDRGEHRAYYACGAVFALAAEAAQKRRTGGDYVDFVRETLRRNRDGVVDEIDWFTQFIDAGGSPEVADRMRLLLTEGAADPAPVVAAILADVGVTLSSGRVILR
ncbi:MULTISPECIES: hypothetical protein [unclassified Brevundimonas]|uniref:hypothetical protein n=1 Tax=unclassified Brevundimonas TaxID=2622653 RepID=UPI0025B836BD|nr:MULTISPECIES: hypothetical protein [unclassified Brevundimonas]